VKKEGEKSVGHFCMNYVAIAAFTFQGLCIISSLHHIVLKKEAHHLCSLCPPLPSA
jgi:hypothetical protein